MMISVTKTRFSAALVASLMLAACNGSTTSYDNGGYNNTSTPASYSNAGLPPEIQACAMSLMTPGCDKMAAGSTLAQMSTDQGVLSNFNNPQVATITLRATADGIRYGTDPVSCGDITALPVAFDGAVIPGRVPELRSFVQIVSRELYYKKGCS